MSGSDEKQMTASRPWLQQATEMRVISHVDSLDVSYRRGGGLSRCFIPHK